MSSIPPPLGSAPIETQVEYLMFQVDRLKTASKILRWAAATAIVLALGSFGGIAGVLYSRGVLDESLRGGVERNRADIQILQRLVFVGRMSPIFKGEDDK